MGWKLALAAAPLHGRPLREAVSEIYGSECLLSDSDVIVENALYPDDRSSRFAVACGAFALVFDWALIEETFEATPQGRPTDLFVLHSVVNLYGFATLNDGIFMRRRAGSSESRIFADEGQPLEIERATVANLAKPGHGIAAWDAWTNPDHTFPGVHDEYDHSSIGEDVVFAVMQERIGFRFDRSSKLSDAIYEQPVFRVG